MKNVREDPRLPLDLSDPRARTQLYEVLREFGAAINDAANERLWLFVEPSTSYSSGLNDHIILCDPAGAITVTLPDAKEMRNKRVVVKRVNSTTYAITVQAVAGQIDELASVQLTAAYQSLELFSDGSNYWILCPCGESGPPPPQ